MAQTTPANTAPARPENLALIFQELFTAIERLRSNRQAVTDAESFRHHIREAVKTAAQEARNRASYSTDDIRMATLAVVGFLDGGAAGYVHIRLLGANCRNALGD